MSEYVVGDSNWRKPPSLQFKPAAYYNGSWDSGAGYARFRSTEHDPTKPGDRKTDVYVNHHRLLAVVACYPDDMAMRDILDHLDGRDVHHKSGMKCDNRPDNLEVTDHGGHSAITQAQMRAYAEDAKRSAESFEDHAADECSACGDSEATLATSTGFEGVRCLSCATAAADGNPIELE